MYFEVVKLKVAYAEIPCMHLSKLKVHIFVFFPTDNSPNFCFSPPLNSPNFWPG